ncbi:YrhK family protein [Atopococcus tabaci]|uniref:YrhK family protein n=1 Tax=Atopococcus tabaci TaxID=269774 RepID=UPI00240A26A6|nr:YrhK family protein [Atopococcus tabaci]
MPEIKKKEREIGPEKEEDVVVKTGRFRIYFQNYYTVISLGNDLLTGGLYFIGSLANLLEAPDLVGQLMYIAGGFFLLMRPILKYSIMSLFMMKSSTRKK